MNPENRALAWRINWYRQSELEGALLLGRLVRTARDPYLIRQLTAHCADEARHSQVWCSALERAGLPFLGIGRSYQSFYAEEGAFPVGMLEVLAFTQIFERRVHKQFVLELEEESLPQALREAFEVMIEDEAGHLGWVHEWLKEQSGAAEFLEKYRRIDEQVYLKICSYQTHLWELPGLGLELKLKTGVSHDD